MARPKKKPPNKDGYYRVDKTIGFTLEGKPIKKAFRSKVSQEDARKKADNYSVSSNFENISFAEWAQKWLWDYKYTQVRENTFEYTYRSTVETHLIPYFGMFKLKDITNNMIQVFFNSRTGLSASLLNKMRICLSQIYETAIANQIVSFSPCTSLSVKSTKKSKDKETYTQDECKEIIEKSKKHRFGIFVRIILQMGLRPSELCGLKWEDIDFKNGTMSIKRACTDLHGMAVIGEPKSVKSKRTIPIPKDLLEELRKNKGQGFVVISSNGKNISPRTFAAKRYDVFLNETGIRKLTPKQMRSTCGTLLYEKCHDIYAVKAFLGHSDVKVTSNIYVQPNPEDLRKQLFQ